MLCAAQTNAHIDAEIAENGGFRTETNWRLDVVKHLGEGHKYSAIPAGLV